MKRTMAYRTERWHYDSIEERDQHIREMHERGWYVQDRSLPEKDEIWVEFYQNPTGVRLEPDFVPT